MKFYQKAESKYRNKQSFWLFTIPAFFALEERESNPVNEAALGLLPRFSYNSGYGNTITTDIDKTGLRQVLNIPDDELEAARKDKHVHYVVADRLGLLDPLVKEAFRGTSYSYSYDEFTRHITDLQSLVSGVPRDLDECIVAEVGVIADMIERANYRDFLDYLIDAKQIVSGRVATIFSAGD